MTDIRATSFGESHELTPIDRLGTWLSRRMLMRVFGSLDGKTLADVGCGFDARFGSSVLAELERLVAIDVSLNPDLLAHEKVTAIVGALPGAIHAVDSGSVDLVALNSVLEHLDEPIETLSELRRIVQPESGVVFVNVPTWFGKVGLETSAFRFGLSPALEIDDHRRYYSRRQLWQSLRDAGFKPSEMRVRHHKFGLNAYAVCRVSP
jgi:2-polyprenyl-3-methyl-5-hydroxy-6-metoxy-1,4-benzoquinol methylase